jgi:hypothetical protein
VSSKDQRAYVRKDDWLAPLTMNTRCASHLGPMPSKSTKRDFDILPIGIGQHAMKDHVYVESPSDRYVDFIACEGTRSYLGAVTPSTISSSVSI